MTPLITLLALTVASFASAVWLTARARSYALTAQLVDVANPRGSHSAPTPRGGGIGIVAACIGGLALGALAGIAPLAVAGALIGGGLPVAAIGWLDDHGHVRASARILAHFAGAGIVVWFLGPFPLAATLPFWGEGWTAVAVVATLLFLVWMINLFNFMDGIDGIAGSEAAGVCICGIALFWLAGVASPAAIAPPLILGAAALGFLHWNWPPARIFMGDVSSGFLGLTLGALALAAGQSASQLAAAWVALLGVFVADATVTLGHRLLRRERVYEAHRSHAYQRLARRWGSHAPVTAGSIAVTLIFCFPIACAIAASVLQPFLGVLLVLIPLGIVALLIGAGSPGD